MGCEIKNNSDYDVSGIEDLIQNLYSFASKRFGFKKPPIINFVSDKANYGVLNKTAHYQPDNMMITIYVDGRHPKDMLRSIAHELVHHMQNEKGELTGVSTEPGYAQKDDHMRNMEKKAFLYGNMCFRDWEDGVKANNPTIYNERRIHKMSYDDWRAKQLSENLLNKWGFKMDLNKLTENKEQILKEGSGDRNDPDRESGRGPSRQRNASSGGAGQHLEEEELEENQEETLEEGEEELEEDKNLQEE